MKKSQLLSRLTSCLCLLQNSIYAAEIGDSDLDLSKTEITYQDNEITVGYWGNALEIVKKIEESPTSVKALMMLN
ncbi:MULTISPECIES: hypothetical protein [Bacillus]|uniref:hypothetical protein n=1 Tax=Bacillus TaxID=1386 RepID=UPI00098A6E88|nr:MULTISPECIES: hypothetical protein [Bacillus]WFA03309.1 hypothetical protein P3X63_11380 [Bacillus sp. HSf4]